MAALFVAVLTPVEGRQYPVTWCMGCGERGMADVVRNLLLFVPLGMVVAGWFRSDLAAFVVPAGLSLAIEAAQLGVPGRDPSLGDFICNSVGGAAGVMIARTSGHWLYPTPRLAGRLSLAWAGLLWLVVAMTGILLAPAPDAPRAGIVERDGDDAVLRPTTVAAKLDLDQPPTRWRGALRAESGDPPRAVRIRGAWCIDPDGRRLCAGATAGGGWGMIAYPDDIARRFGAWMDAAWVALLFLPLGLWMRRTPLHAAALSVALASLIVLPALGILAATPVLEWIGAAVGIGAGMAIGWMVRRHDRSVDDPNDSHLPIICPSSSEVAARSIPPR